MEPTLADKLEEIHRLAELASQKRKELEAQVSKLTQERFSLLRQAEERKKQIRELRDGIKQLPPVQVTDLGATVLAVLKGPGTKTLRDICQITGLSNKAVSQCLQGLVKQGKVIRTLPEGRKRGASYKPIHSVLVKNFDSKATEVAQPELSSGVAHDRCSFGNDKSPRQAHKSSNSGAKIETSSKTGSK